jgi:tRNA dimethylallyltransferase
MEDSSVPNLICILGPTASGKTNFAAMLAGRIRGEIISADSRQVYRGMDIGTGKDYADYIVNGKNIPFHLIDIADAGFEYNVFLYQKDFYRVFEEIRNRAAFPILCGGTGMYIESVLNAYRLLQVPINEELRKELEDLSIEKLSGRLRSYKNPHNTTDTIIRKRLIRAIEIEEYLNLNPFREMDIPEIRPLIFGMDIDRELRRERITARLRERLENGMIEEVRNLLESGVKPEMLEFYGLEYKFLCRYITGKADYNEMFYSLNTAIHQFAKRQMTWFRKMEREGTVIHWLDSSLSFEEKYTRVKNLAYEKGLKFS